MLLRVTAWLVAVVAAVGGLLAPASAATFPEDIYSTNDFGGIGLITTRTARFSPDGQFEIGASFVEPYRRYYMNWQILPWAEITFRYTDVTNVINGGPVLDQSQGRFWKDIISFGGGDHTYLDRAFDFKFKIWDEGRIRPAFAIGLQDTIGTGLFSAEYMVFTKRIADFDVTAGLGWGYMATRNTIRNPMRIFSSSFDRRSADVGRGGNLGLGNFFSGPRAGIFAGVEYFTPVKSLSIKLEYSSSDLQYEPLHNPQEESFPVNVAVNWRPHDWFDMQLGFERGNALMLKMAFRQNFRLPGLPHVMDPPPPKVRVRQPVQPAEIRSGRSEPPDRTWLDIAKASLAAREVHQRSYASNTRAALAKGADDLTPSSFASLMARRTAHMEEARETADIATDSPSGGGLEPIRVSAAARQALSESEGAASGALTSEDEEVAKRVFQSLGRAGYPVEAFEMTEDTATVYYLDVRFREFSKNLGRISRVLANELPPRIEQFTLVYVGKGIETSRVSVLRKDIENAANMQGSPEEIWANAVIEAPHVDQSLPPDAVRNGSYPSFSWSLRPTLQQHVGDPDTGLLIADLRASLTADLKLRRNLSISVGVSKFLFGNLDKITRGAGSKLPHVRSDIREYVQQGRDSLDQLQITYLFRPTKHVWGRLSAGIFEMMYGGVSGEVYYKRPESPWGIGLDLNWVKKRDFDQGFGFQDYQTVTGHLAFHYDLPVYDLHFSTSVGRYLAGDRGVTFDLSRRFPSGVVVGGFFTLTNVSAQDFGEGSFDKGFYMRIPLDMFLLRSSTHTMNFLFRPLTRDGGQMVNVGPRASGVPASDGYDRIMKSWDDFMR